MAEQKPAQDKQKSDVKLNNDGLPAGKILTLDEQRKLKAKQRAENAKAKTSKA